VITAPGSGRPLPNSVTATVIENALRAVAGRHAGGAARAVPAATNTIRPAPKDVRMAHPCEGLIASFRLIIRFAIWVGIESGKTLDLTFLPQADLEARMTPAP
jgi:hypothetical protein